MTEIHEAGVDAARDALSTDQTRAILRAAGLRLKPDQEALISHWARLAVEAAADAIADDIRTLGWSVAVHNDYRQNGEPHTFWLFTKGDRCVKGEGRTDADALNQIRRTLERCT